MPNFDSLKLNLFRRIIIRINRIQIFSHPTLSGDHKIFPILVISLSIFAYSIDYIFCFYPPLSFSSFRLFSKLRYTKLELSLPSLSLYSFMPSFIWGTTGDKALFGHLADLTAYINKQSPYRWRIRHSVSVYHWRYFLILWSSFLSKNR